ncbi:RAD55 family ATPase [Methanohalophilus portucalensis]|uniref:RecA-superfamily ATPase, KaiC/GvpD/RAD55 family n=2 Tax=Methanohalophilus portucalensis TaxID=39664 RepID=A0A1L9C5V7_9EURY|nr:ATPase domain-containing protein [Methanohalophilus portucalensis]ATU08571.1 signal transduction protein [Methanohalophilus portucalensis]OJH49939.1 signal transduction ATPase [Methanohalophilus portucalensis FDF-1]RNI13256.1 signal transduction protein [Methanohalophilus portucalensis FDF-1]SMH32701.1 RecA-superfamily ATPase, KaiC/GvpD/RAD55 family [Methanohalophilus portucalensis FDF-1]
MRFIDTVQGLNNIFANDIPKGSIILVTGPPGTLKSGLTFSLLSNYLENSDEYGVYITLEESKASHLRNMDSMGLKLSERLFVSDYSDYRLKFEEASGNENLIEVIGNNIMKYKEKKGEKFTCLGIDSLGALYSLMDTDPSKLRKQLFHLFEPLRRENITTFVIFETYDIIGQTQQSSGMEGYLSDGIIDMMIKTKDNSSQRYIQVKKMRATSHSMDPYILTVSGNGIEIYKDTTF